MNDHVTINTKRQPSTLADSVQDSRIINTCS